MGRRRQKGEERDLALRRIERLLALAHGHWPARSDLSDRYAVLASRLATRYQTGLPPALRPLVCKACHSYLGHGRTRVRLRRGRRVVTCLACGDVRRRPLETLAGAGRDRPAARAAKPGRDAGEGRARP